MLLLNGAYLGLVDYYYNSKDGKFIFLLSFFPVVVVVVVQQEEIGGDGLKVRDEIAPAQPKERSNPKKNKYFFHSSSSSFKKI
jgi:hypothetical protein